tara:strand:+ start:1002 stop:1700 length:699 start_codon:yes stop_codon:yes gene_type:complete
MSSHEEENWAIGKPAIKNDAHGLITEFIMSWETMVTFEADDDLYDDYEGSSASAGADITGLEQKINTTFSQMSLITSGEIDTGVAPFRITSVDTSLSSITSGFSVAYEFDNPPFGVGRDWFDNVVVVDSHKKDYEAHPSSVGVTYALELLFDRTSDSHSSFSRTFSKLVNTYVKDIYGSLGDLRETSVTHKRSPKHAINLKDTSTFDLDKFEQTGTPLTTSTITATLSTGEY